MGAKNARLKRRACKGKTRYSTQEVALGALIALHRNRGYQGYLQPYRCRFCGAFHFGHSNKS